MIKRSEGKINANFKINAFYKEYKKQVKKPLDKSLYSDVRTALYEELTKQLYANGEFKLPFKFGIIKIQKRKRKIVYNSDGSINKIGYKVDWKKSKDYWAVKYPGLSPEQLKEIKGKTKIYCESEWRLSINYLKTNAQFINKHFTWFKPSRDLARGLKDYTDLHPNIDYREK